MKTHENRQRMNETTQRTPLAVSGRNLLTLPGGQEVWRQP
jgi:hypothetical protein